MTVIEEMIVIILYVAAGLAALGGKYRAVHQKTGSDDGGDIHNQQFLMNTNKEDITARGV